MNFCKETRPKIVEENPGITFGEVGKKLGEAWKKLSDDEKELYRSKVIPPEEEPKVELKVEPAVVVEARGEANHARRERERERRRRQGRGEHR